MTELSKAPRSGKDRGLQAGWMGLFPTQFCYMLGQEAYEGNWVSQLWIISLKGNYRAKQSTKFVCSSPSSPASQNYLAGVCFLPPSLSLPLLLLLLLLALLLCFIPTFIQPLPPGRYHRPQHLPTLHRDTGSGHCPRPPSSLLPPLLQLPSCLSLGPRASWNPKTKQQRAPNSHHGEQCTPLQSC